MTVFWKKSFATGFLVLVLLTSVAGSLIAPRPALAILGVADTSATTVVANIPSFKDRIVDALKKIGESALVASISTALVNTITYAADRLAYDAAVFVASGGDGDDPLFENRTIGEYFADYGASVAADALGQLDDTGIFGNFSLCQPDVSVTLAFKFGIKSAFDRPEPACEFKDIAENWDGFYTTISTSLYSPEEKNSIILTKLADMYNPSENDFSTGILVYTSVLTKAQQDASLAAQRELFGGFFKDKTDFITGKVETPAEIIQNKVNDAWRETDAVRRQIAIQALGDKDVLLQVGIHAGSVFTNTLLSKVTEKIYNGLFGDLDQVDINPFDSYSYNSGSSDDARQAYRNFLTATILSVQNYSILEEFSACPYQGKGLYNCVADSSLVSAVARADGGVPLTVAEAIEDGLLNASWPLIPSSDHARDQDMYCYTYGYCHGNLVKLRKARIISTGWELAAESTANSDSNPVTLGDVVDGFYDCNAQNELDDNHPWCHLIDPNWVLKYPETQCRNQAYGQLLESSVSDQRKTECVDMPSCIDEDGDGNCTGGYGYCVREENVWNFRGESCPDYYGSCTTYENPEGEEVDFLSNTTDSGVCTADSAGCLWYGTQKTADSDANFDWPDYSSATVFAAAEVADDIYRNRIYFTAKVEDCAAEDAGCRELVSRKDGTTLNMVMNPSFESDDDDDGVPDGWFIGGTGESYEEDTSTALDGADSVNPGSSGLVYEPGIVLSQSTEYTLSFYAAQNAGTATTGVLLELSASNSESVDFRGYSLDGDCAVHSTSYDTLKVAGTPTSTDYERFSCTFTVPTLTDASAEITASLGIAGGDLFFDGVQLEQESEVSTYHEGYSAAVLDLAYVKVPPTYLGCTGGADDPADCDDYAGICAETDVGCSLYTPENGDPSVAGIAGSLDECPSSCVGYDTFKQEPTLYEPEGDFPLYFIPDSAQTCTARYVGCDEFTNISTEEVSYFTYVRACVTTDQAEANTSSDNAAIFYTWEGSDTDGYQLKTWNLLESDMGSSAYTYAGSGESDDAPNLAPCTNWVTTDGGITCNDDSVSSGTLDADTTSCDQHSDTITNPDCREFYDTEGTIHYREWTSTVTVNDACTTYRKTDIVGADTTAQIANCEDSGGYFDTTTAQCRYYGYASESDSCPATESGCREYTGGRSRNSRQAFIEYFENGDITNWDANSATDVTLSNESIATGGHSLYSDDQSVWTYVGGDGTACSSTDGCTTTAGALGGTCALGNGETYCGTLDSDVFRGKTYVLSFWAKGSGTLSVGFDTSRISGTATIDAAFASGTDAITLDTTWKQYSYGPINMDASTYPDFGEGTSALVFTPSSGTIFYIDNVALREGEDNIDVIKDSWVTPAACDETEGGTASPQYMLGCQEYSDQNGDTAYLKSFSSLCDESKVGCSSFFFTQESDDVGAAVYGALCSTLDGSVATSATLCYFESSGTSYDTSSEYLCTVGVGQSSCEFNLDWYAPPSELPSHLSYVASTVISPADKDIFLVVTSDVECSSGVAGCMEVGLPVFSQDHTSVSSWTTKYLMNSPEDYAETLCSQDELFCDAWTDNDNTTSYFKDPQDQTCEYRTGVTISNTTYSGWFKSGTDELCDPDYVIGGDSSGIWRNGDDAYDNWVGTCLAKYDSCTEFQDISDLASDELYGESDGTSYYYLNNDSLEENSLPDSQKCNGEVSQTDGCGLFNDSSDPAKTSSATATYVASTHADQLFGAQQNDFVDPINCDEDSTITTPDGDTVDLCEKRCWYDADDFYDISGADSSYIYDGSCYEQSDCRPLTSESGAEVIGYCKPGPRLENDSNTVLKVNRDRECSEWLACSDAQTTWDERTNSYVTICGDIGLCTQYSGTSNASFCSAWKDNEPAVVLDADVYSSRDVSWYGDEYSGYAIPELLPVDQLTQVNVAGPLTCNTAGRGASLEYYDGFTCTDDSDCGGSAGGSTYCEPSVTTDYRLAYIAGSCEGSNYGDECSVGYCENTGSSCIDSDACGVDGGSCLIGTCYTVSTQACASTADCTSGGTCLGGYCAVDEGDSTTEDADDRPLFSGCTATQKFYPSVNYKTGTCMYDQCILTPDGRTFDTNSSEASTCRAYPEINSPFGNEIVTQWQDPTDLSAPISSGATTENADALAVSYVQNFENVQTCGLGEDCLCSYKKISYGDDSTIRYYADDTDIDYDTKGICNGGLTGSFCEKDADCEDDDGNTGTCSLPSKIDDVLGLEGYCLERDSSTNILGDKNLNACLTWLPVDQLAGATDLYAKYTEAGYWEETNYCSYLGLYASVNTEWGCLERDDTEPLVSHECMNENTACPAGFVMVAGAYKGATGVADTDANDACAAGSENDCPFMCVPVNSVTDSGEDCLDIIKSYDSSPTSLNQPSNYKLDRYWIGSGNNYQAAFDKLIYCTTYGVEYNQYHSYTYYTDHRLPYWHSSWGWLLEDNYTGCGGGDCGWKNYTGFASEDRVLPYLGCKELTQVSSGDSSDGSAPWTDVLLNPNNQNNQNKNLVDMGLVSSSYPAFGYVYETKNSPFGAAQSLTDIYSEYGDASPSYINQCRTGDGSSGSWWYLYPATGTPTVENDGLSCSSGRSEVGAGVNDSEAASYVSFDKYGYFLGYWAEVFPATFSNISASGGGASNILNRIFARALTVYQFVDGVYDSDDVPRDEPVDGYYESTTIYNSDARWDDRAEYGNPPSVWAVDMNNCYNDECEEDQDHALTLNDQNEGDVESDMFYRAYLKFYAAADKNQLPLRRIIVDWGDGSTLSGSTASNNFYKNHRGLEDGKETSICDKPVTDSDYEWGMSSESCDPNYFSYNHIYTCNPSRITESCADSDGDGIYDNTPCTETGNECVYRPRVHVRDNWGWCTGVCTAGTVDGGDGCFDEGDIGTNDLYTKDECIYATDAYEAFGNVPFVSYDGVITVTP